MKKEDLFEARDYQLNAAREVLQKGNSLVIMPTALGKTFVAALVAKELLSKKPSSKILFLAPTKPLVLQQAKRLAELLALEESEVAVITGEVPKEQRTSLYADASVKVVCSTPQTTENDLKEISLSGFSLIVFDEVHRAIGEYAYTAVAAAARNSSHALLLGLTASPSAREEKIREICEHLDIRHVVAKQESDEDVAPYVQEIELDWKSVELPPQMKELRTKVAVLAQEPYSILQKLEFLGLSSGRPNKTQLLAARSRLLAWQNPVRFRSLTLLARLMNLLHAQDLLETQGVSALHNYLLNLQKRTEESRAVRELAADSRIKLIERECEKLLGQGVDHPKLDFLLEYLKPKVSQGRSAIVFAHYRDSVKNLLQKINASGIAAKSLVGRAGKGMSQKDQAEVVQQFREKHFPVLVSTSIGEEGLDIPSVDLVVFYDAVPSEVRLIQRRGRTGRVRAGETIILYTKDTKDEAYHWSSRGKEKRMKELVEKLKDELSGKPDASGQTKISGFTETANDGDE